MALDATAMEAVSISPAAVPQDRPRRPRILSHTLLIAICIIVGFPMIFTVIKATQDPGQMTTLIPGSQALQNFSDALTTTNLGQLMLNTIIVAVLVTLGKTITSLLAGMAFVYFKFPLRGFLFLFVLLTLMMPTDILVVALYRLMAQLHWLNTTQALVIPFIASATGVLLFRQHFLNIPSELADAAQIDGANAMRFLWSILIPLSWNVIGALAMIQFVSMWNQYLWPLLVINDNNRELVQVALKGITANAMDQGDYGIAMAAAVIASIPPLLVFLVLQESFLRGFALTREK